MLSNNPRRMPLPIFIEYDRRGERVRKEFNGLSSAARLFFTRKLKEGKNPRVVNPNKVDPPADHINQLPED
ncbi:MAG: hypothetical protein L0241_30775 [Planctomycetia bacterium]|nr:hypothetical protein [Planctomycetia bacterium]